MKISEIIERVIAYHPPFTREHTTDVIKFGDPEQECTGVVVTCFPSIDVIRRTAELSANFLIVHEPLFWSHEDTIGWLENSAVYQTKRQLLSDAGIVVWRDHDHMHGEGWGPKRVNLDGMYDGIMRELSWEPYLVESKKKPLVFQIPETDGEALGHELMEKLNLKGIRIVGDRHTKVSRVFLCEHIGSNDRNAEEKLLRTEMEEYDALIPLEIIDWTLCAYIRDSCQAGRPKVLYNYSTTWDISTWRSLVCVIWRGGCPVCWTGRFRSPMCSLATPLTLFFEQYNENHRLRPLRCGRRPEEGRTDNESD